MSLSTGKTYYSISEVCQETDLEQHVLRYWETEFSMLKPKKNRAGNRAYRKKEIELIKYIKFLLYDKHYTIQGAKKVLHEQKAVPLEVEKTEVPDLPTTNKSFLVEIKGELNKIKMELDELIKIGKK